MENSPFLEPPIEDDSIPNNDGELSFSDELKTLGQNPFNVSKIRNSCFSGKCFVV
jgi:hypothetical protein